MKDKWKKITLGGMFVVSRFIAFALLICLSAQLVYPQYTAAQVQEQFSQLSSSEKSQAMDLIKSRYPNVTEATLSTLTNEQVERALGAMSPGERQQLSKKMKDSGLSDKLGSQHERALRNSLEHTKVLRVAEGDNIVDTNKKVAQPSPIEGIYIYRFDPDKHIQKDKREGNKAAKNLGFSQQFGYDIFSRAVSDSFSSANLPLNNDYILGPGDSLVIHMWGKVEERIDVTIDRDGKVMLPRIGEVYLAGVRYGDIMGLIKNKMSRLYVNFDINVSLGRLRSVKVYVLGDVTHPGAYDLPAMSTVFDALYMAKGATKMGSLRDIKLVRNGREAANVDLYTYLLEGDKSNDPVIENNDTIFVSSIGKTVKVAGTVKRPAIYEIVPGTSLFEAIQLAGGMTATAFYKRVQVVRIVEGEHRQVLDMSVTSQKAAKKRFQNVILHDGDLVRIDPISTTLKNYVTIKGHVQRPGDYEFRSGMTVSQLIKKAEGFLDNVYTNRIEIYRYQPEDNRQIITLDFSNEQHKKVKLRDWDRVRIYGAGELTSDPTVTVRGAVSLPGLYPLYKDMRASDLIFMGKPNLFANLEEIELHRRQEDGGSKIHIIDYASILDGSDPDQDVYLRSEDEIFIKMPEHQLEFRKVTISGEVKYPGIYTVNENETFRSVLERAGGYTDEAYPRGVIFTRDIAADIIGSNQARILANEEKRFIYDQSLIADLPQEEAMLAESVISSRTKALAMLRDQVGRVDNRVIIDLSTSESVGYDLVLKNADFIRVPSKPSTIHVVGGVHNPSLIFYQDGKDLKYYLGKVGGYNKFADKKNVVVFKTDGSVSHKSVDIEPGDIVYVPEKIKIPFSWWRFSRMVLTQLTLVAESVASIVLLQTVVNQL